MAVVVVTGFVVLPFLLAGGFVAACEWAGRRVGDDAATRRRRALRVGAAVALWLTLTAWLADSGVLRRFDLTPPPFAILMLAVAAIGIAVPFSSLGTLLVRGVPLWALVGFQAFRWPLEMVMHRAYVEGIMPVQMSYSGRNFDIVSGITAAGLGLWLKLAPAPRAIVAMWNLLGLALLANVVAIAVLSTPIFRWFGDERLSTFVTYAPFVWLPAILVAAALMGHVLLARRLVGTERSDDR